jgi:hypothetical protein
MYGCIFHSFRVWYNFWNVFFQESLRAAADNSLRNTALTDYIHTFTFRQRRNLGAIRRVVKRFDFVSLQSIVTSSLCQLNFVYRAPNSISNRRTESGLEGFFRRLNKRVGQREMTNPGNKNYPYLPNISDRNNIKSKLPSPLRLKILEKEVGRFVCFVSRFLLVCSVFLIHSGIFFEETTSLSTNEHNTSVSKARNFNQCNLF